MLVGWLVSFIHRFTVQFTDSLLHERTAAAVHRARPRRGRRVLGGAGADDRVHGADGAERAQLSEHAFRAEHSVGAGGAE